MIQKAQQSEFEVLVRIWENSVRATHSFLLESDIIFFKSKILNEYLYLVSLYIYKDEFENILGFIGIDELDVNEQNPNAVNFYSHMGFTVIKRSEIDSLGKPFPILTMRLETI